jgi:1-acyl-sn-glycerol-3-phosphate acyltransferase
MSEVPMSEVPTSEVSPGTTARTINYALDTAKPGPPHGPLSGFFRATSLAYLKLTGWRLRGDWPNPNKAILLAAPHTSNWDGLLMLAAAAAYQVKLRWMGKKALVKGPLGGMMRWLGVVPVDRSASNDMVAQMADAIAKAQSLILAVAPEGTRSKVTEWKKGFYHIALKANVPIIFAVLDYGTKTISVSGAIWPSGDYAADYAFIKSHYLRARGKFDGFFCLPD